MVNIDYYPFFESARPNFHLYGIGISFPWLYSATYQFWRSNLEVSSNTEILSGTLTNTNLGHLTLIYLVTKCSI